MSTDTETTQSAPTTRHLKLRTTLTQKKTDQAYSEFSEKLARFARMDYGAREYPHLRTELVSGHMPLAEHIAVRFRRRGIAVEDLRQVAMIDLVKAVDRFDPL